MKKKSDKERLRDIRREVKYRQGRDNRRSKRDSFGFHNRIDEKAAQRWVEKMKLEGVMVKFYDQKVTLILPEKMNFSDEYENTVRSLKVIRLLTNRALRLANRPHLSEVKFDNLKSISTSAALVLTAELSRWDDIINKSLKPRLRTWDPIIIQRFATLGFFELFKNAPNITLDKQNDNLKLVRYIKGKCGDKNKTKVLKASLQELIGDQVTKWTFLHTGLSEAITNVSHHAYPDGIDCNGKDKNWYLTGSLNTQSKMLKIAFYDQGIGIPRSLPASKIYERVLSFLSALPQGERKLHTALLEAAVKIDRTSTGSGDRGKGLPDLLEFIKQRKEGYLSILSLKGLYKYSIENGKEKTKTFPFETELPGTLIIWSVKLQENQ